MTTDWLVGLLDLLFPRACALCGAAVEGPPHDDALCPPCLAALGPPRPILPLPAPLAAGVAAGPFDGPLRDAIHLLKYAGRGDLAPALGRRLAAALAAGPRPDVVVPVPLHPARFAVRGFNQAARLARPVARRLEAPLEAGLLVRLRDTPPQTARDASARRRNVRRAFAVRRPAAFAGQAVLLVDDVVTTGATAAACAAALLAAGARQVRLAALARALSSWPGGRLATRGSRAGA